MSMLSRFRGKQHDFRERRPFLFNVLGGIVAAFAVAFFLQFSDFSTAAAKWIFEAAQADQAYFDKLGYAISSIILLFVVAGVTIYLLVVGSPEDELKELLLREIAKVYNFHRKQTHSFVEDRLVFEGKKNKRDTLMEELVIRSLEEPVQMVKRRLASDVPLSDFPVTDFKTEGDGRNVVMLPAIDTKNEKKWLFYFHPVITDPQKVVYSAQWHNLWRNLRTTGRDEIAYVSKVPTQRVFIELKFDVGVFGRIEWDPANPKYDEVSLDTEVQHGLQILSLQISNPRSGTEYLYAFRRVVS